jgi:uncharacterized RDD family membrane protein YckC
VKSNTAEKLGGERLNLYAAPTDAGAPVAQNDVQVELATPWMRLAAQLVDAVLFVAAAAFGGFVVGFVQGFLGGLSHQPGHAADSVAALASAAAGISALSFYSYQCWLIAGTGQSLGKRWCHVRIVGENGAAPGFWKGVVIRSWALALPSAIPFFGFVVALVDGLMVFSEGQRCLHDRMAGTRVLKA